MRHRKPGVRKEGRGEAGGEAGREGEVRGEGRRRGPGCWVSVLESDPAQSIAGCSPQAQGGTPRLISFCQSQFSCLFPRRRWNLSWKMAPLLKGDINISCFHHFHFAPDFRSSIFLEACAGSSRLISLLLSLSLSLSSFLFSLPSLPPSVHPDKQALFTATTPFDIWPELAV